MAPLARGERRELDVTVTVIMRTLEGWVRARSGASIERAQVSIVSADDENFSAGTTTEPDGSFHLEEIAAPTVPVFRNVDEGVVSEIAVLGTAGGILQRA